MINLLRAELYRLKRTKSFWVVLGMAIICSFISVATFKLMEGAYDEAMMDAMFDGALGDIIGGGGGNNMQLLGMIGQLSGQVQFFTLFDGNFMQVLIAVFISLYIVVDYHEGTFTHVIGKGFSRAKVFLSKYIVLCLAALAIITVYLISGTIVGTVLWGFGDIADGFFIQALSYLGSMLLMHMAYAALCMIITALSRNTGIAIAINLFILVALPMLISAMNYMLSLEFNINDYWMVPYVTTLSGTDVSAALYGRGALMGIIYMIILTIAGIIIFKKQDI